MFGTSSFCCMENGNSQGTQSRIPCGFRIMLFCATFWLGMGSIPEYAWSLSGAEPLRVLNPSDWGGDHVGQPIPEFVTGGECLFCHRMNIGPKWGQNRHYLTVRGVEAEPEAFEALKDSRSLNGFAEDVQFVIGRRQHLRFLKRSHKFGKLMLLSARWQRSESGGKFINLESLQWHTDGFGERCAGCHLTGVNSEARTYSVLSIDCYVCHGDASLDHSKDPDLMLLSQDRQDPPRVIASVCGQCHIRTGSSRSTGLPFANNFVPGDNLFRDLEVSFPDPDTSEMNPAEGHIYENIRQIIHGIDKSLDCLSCHSIHDQSDRRHRRLKKSNLCTMCHDWAGDELRYSVENSLNELCDYPFSTSLTK